MKKQTLNFLAAAVLGLSGSAHAANGIIFDPNGDGAGQIFIDEFSTTTGNVVFDNVVAGVGLEGYFVGQTIITGGAFQDIPVSFGVSPHLFTYQFIIPVTGSTAGDTLTITQRAGTSTFSIFADTILGAGNQPNSVTGLGFGDLNGGSLTGGQFEILTGSVDINSGSYAVTDETVQNSLSPGSAGFLGLSNGTDVATNDLSGSGQLDVTVTSKNDAYFVNDFPAFSIGLTLESFSISTPFGSNVNVSDSVVNIGGTDLYFGEPQAISAGPAAGNSLPVNDLLCFAPGGVGGGGDNSPCDIQAQVSSNVRFTTNVPEPASLGLVGITLLGAGVVRRQRKNRT